MSQEEFNSPAIAERANNLIEAAGRAEITDQDTYEKGTDLIKLIGVAFNKAEDERKGWVKPLNDHVSRINGEFKKITVPLKTAKDAVTKLCTTYALEQQRIRDEEALKQAQEEERIQKEAKEAEDAAERQRQEAVDKLAEAESSDDKEAVAEAAQELEQANSIAETASELSEQADHQLESTLNRDNTQKVARGDLATGSIRKTWKFEVKDISKVPPEYLEVVSKLVNQAIRDGVREIDGLYIYQDSSLTVR